MTELTYGEWWHARRERFDAEKHLDPRWRAAQAELDGSLEGRERAREIMKPIWREMADEWEAAPDGQRWRTERRSRRERDEREAHVASCGVCGAPIAFGELWTRTHRIEGQSGTVKAHASCAPASLPHSAPSSVALIGAAAHSEMLARFAERAAKQREARKRRQRKERS